MPIATGRTKKISAASDIYAGDYLLVNPDSRYLAVALSWWQDRSVAAIYDIASGKRIARFKGHQEYVSKIRFDPTGKILASCSNDQTVKLWRIEP